MPVTANEFLDVIESRGIMSPDHVDHLRDQLAEAGVDIHPVHVARKLVDAGYLNPYFAKTLLEELNRAKRRSSTSAEEDELDLAPLEEELQEAEVLKASAAPAVELNIDLPPIRDPDQWPPAGGKSSLLPAANPQYTFDAENKIETVVFSRRPRSGVRDWLIGSLGAAVAVLVVLVILLLVWR